MAKSNAVRTALDACVAKLGESPSLAINLSKQGSRAKIEIHGVIGGSWDGTGVTAKNFKQRLTDLGNVEAIDVHIYSPGGSIAEGWVIFNALNDHPATITTHADGNVASMATVLMMAGETRTMPKNALFMIHQPLTIGMGNAADFRKLADVLDKLSTGIVDAYMDAGVTAKRDEVIAMMDEETYLTAQEALDHGFITAIGKQNESTATAEDSATALLAQLTNLSGIPAKPMEAVNMTAPAAPAPATGNITQEAMDAATKAAASAAHQRVIDIMALSKPGLEEFVANLAKDTSITLADAKIKVADEYIKLASNKLDASASSRNPPVAPDPAPAAAGNTLEERWAKNQGGVQNQFLDFAGFKAFEEANGRGLIKILNSK